MSEPVVYPLKHPVELKNTKGEVVETITELHMKRLNGAALREVANARAKGDGDLMTVLVCKSAGIPRSTFDQLDGEDCTDAGEIAGGFIGGGQKTGEM